jgi:hypothetical protein
LSRVAGRTATVRSERWTPARIFMLAAAVVHLPLGIAGLAYDQTFPVGATAAERASSELIFGIFETNGWHSLSALVLGIITAYFTMYPRRARDAALMIGLLHVGIVGALVLWQPSTFWLASNGADQVVHASVAIGGIASALLTRPQGSETATPPPGPE